MCQLFWHAFCIFRMFINFNHRCSKVILIQIHVYGDLKSEPSPVALLFVLERTQLPRNVEASVMKGLLYLHCIMYHLLSTELPLSGNIFSMACLRMA